MSAIARRLDATDGQVWSLALGLLLAIVLAVAGIPPVLHHVSRSSASPASPAVSPVASTSHATRTPTPAGPAAEPSPSVRAGPGSTTNQTTFGPATNDDVVTSAAPPALFGTVVSLATVPAPLAGIAAGGGRVFVATDGGAPSHVFTYDLIGQRVGDIIITGQPDHHSRGITGLAVGPDGALYATDAATARVLRIDPASGRQTTIATIADLPSCVLAPAARLCEPGLEDHRPLVRGIARAADGTLYVTDSGQATVWRIRPGGQAETWSQSMQQASGDGPTAVAIAPDGSVVCTVGTDLNPFNATAASVYRIPVGGNGSAGTPVLVAKLAKGDQPTGVAAGSNGRIYVALHGPSAIVVLNANGSEVTRLRAASIDGPAGLGLSSGDDLYSTTQPTDGPSQLLHISVTGGP
ncbi:MAG: hypothetical protein JWO37_2120 [Acidimicrobiales bacterium]|jgi:sugar lactone lactonase YvrE|nr:hypothetical protein [Acidimicrobiales bacterium]